jgi:hypothetical protein
MQAAVRQLEKTESQGLDAIATTMHVEALNVGPLSQASAWRVLTRGLGLVLRRQEPHDFVAVACIRGKPPQRVVRRQERPELILSITRDASPPSPLEIDIVRRAFGVARQATVEQLASGGVVLRWYADECAACGRRRFDPLGWGVVQNAELCPRHYQIAGDRRLAELRELAHQVEQPALF